MDKKRKIGFVCRMLIYEVIKLKKINKKYLQKLDQEISLIPLSYDRAFKSVFKINLDILRDFLKVTVPLDINSDDKISLLDSEIPVKNKKEYQKNVDILVVINEKIYIDIEMNRSKFEHVDERNFSYGDIIYTRVVEKGEDIKGLKCKYVYQLNLNANPIEEVLEDDVVSYGLVTHKIYRSNMHTLLKGLELYRDLYYNKINQSEEAIWYAILIARNFSELYELAKKVLDENKVQRLMEAVINMSKDDFILHEWQKDKWDEYIKYNEIEDAKKEGKSIGIKEKALEIAQNMLKKKMNIQDICEITGLSLQDVQLLENTEN